MIVFTETQAELDALATAIGLHNRVLKRRVDVIELEFVDHGLEDSSVAGCDEDVCYAAAHRECFAADVVHACHSGMCIPTQFTVVELIECVEVGA